MMNNENGGATKQGLHQATKDRPTVKGAQNLHDIILTKILLRDKTGISKEKAEIKAFLIVISRKIPDSYDKDKEKLAQIMPNLRNSALLDNNYWLFREKS
jgi:hypothetical protein